jgi:hypothetical protein
VVASVSVAVMLTPYQYDVGSIPRRVPRDLGWFDGLV